MKKRFLSSAIAAMLIAASLLTGCSDNTVNSSESEYDSCFESQENTFPKPEESEEISVESNEEEAIEESQSEIEYTYTRLKDVNSECSNYGHVYFCANAIKYNYPSHTDHYVEETYTTKTRLTAKSSEYYCTCGEHEKNITEYLTADGDKWYFESSEN